MNNLPEPDARVGAPTDTERRTPTARARRVSGATPEARRAASMSFKRFAVIALAIAVVVPTVFVVADRSARVGAASPDLSSLWELDETAGTVAADSGPSASDGTYVGSVGLGVASHGSLDGTAIDLSGGHVSVPAAAVAGDTRGYSIWFRTADEGVLLGLADESPGASATTSMPLMYVGVDGLLRAGTDPTALLTSSAPVNDDVWHRAVLNITPTSQTLYLDGVEVATTSASPAANGWATDAHLGTGWTEAATSDFSVATLDESTGSVGAVGPWSSGSFVPSPATHLVVTATIMDDGGGNAAAGDDLSITDSAGLTWTQHGDVEVVPGVWGGIHKVWTAPVGAAAGQNTTVSIDRSSGFGGGYAAISVVEVGGLDAAAPVTQADSSLLEHGGISFASHAGTLPTAVASDGRVLAIVGAQNDLDAPFDPPAGFETSLNNTAPYVHQGVFVGGAGAGQTVDVPDLGDGVWWSAMTLLELAPTTTAGGGGGPAHPATTGGWMPFVGELDRVEVRTAPFPVEDVGVGDGGSGEPGVLEVLPLTSDTGENFANGAWTTAAVSPAPNSTLVVAATATVYDFFDATAATEDIVITDTAGLTWTAQAGPEVLAGFYGGIHKVWTADVGPNPPSAMTIDLDIPDAGYSAAGWTVLQLTGHDPTAPIVQVDTQTASYGGTSEEPHTHSMTSAPDVDSLVVAIFATQNDAAASFSVPAGYDDVVNDDTPYVHHGVFTQIGATSQDITVSDTGDQVYWTFSTALEIAPAPPAEPPAPPSNLTASAGDAIVGLTWDGVAEATGYRVYRAEAGGALTALADVTGTTYDDVAVTNGVTYDYAIASMGDAGEGDQSAPVSATPQYPPLDAPTGLAAVAADGSVSLSWDAVTGATSYRIYRAEDGGAFAPLVDEPGTAYVDTSVTNGTTYDYAVATVNNGIEGDQSVSVSATPQVELLDPPTGLSATAGDAVVTVSWDAVTGADSYQLYRTESGGTLAPLSLVSGATTYVDPTVLNGTTYDYAIASVNAAGEGAQSTTVEATPQVGVLPPPANVTGTAGSGVVDLSWDPVTGSTGYRVYRAESGGTLTAVADVTDTVYADTAVTNGTSYDYAIATLNVAGEGAQSTVITVAPQVDPLDAPTGFLAIASPGLVRLSWNAVADADGYRIYRTVAGGTPIPLVDVTGTSHDDTTVTDGAIYEYSVAALNAAGAGAQSTIATAAPGSAVISGLPASATGLRVSADGNWMLFREGTTAVWRSNNGDDWERIVLPGTTGQSYSQITIDESGAVLVAHRPNWLNSTAANFYRYDDEWSGPHFIFQQGSKSAGALRGIAARDGVIVLAVAKGFWGWIRYSVDGGETWLASASLPYLVPTGGAGDHIFFTAPGRESRRWSLTSRSPVSGSGPVFPSSVAFWSSPGAPNEVWATAYDTSALASTGSPFESVWVSAWHSTDDGATWTQLMDQSPVPARAGVRFSSPEVRDDGKLYMYGSSSPSGSLVVHEAIWDPATGEWSVERLDSGVSGSLLVWPNTDDGTGEPVRWARTSDSVLAITGSGVPDPTVVTSQTSPGGGVLLDGLASPVVSAAVSPSGTWRLVHEGGGVYWRSPDGVTWERTEAPIPTGVSGVRAAIADDGTIGLAYGYWTYYGESYAIFFEDGEWFGPRLVSIHQHGTALPTWVGWTSSDDFIVRLGSSFGKITSNKGRNWIGASFSGVPSFAANDLLHQVTTTAYSRISTVDGQLQTIDDRGDGTSGTSVPVPSGTRGIRSGPNSMLLVKAGTTLQAFRSPDDGATWEADPVANIAMPFGVDTELYEMLDADTIRFYDIAECATSTLVYTVDYSISSAAWSDVEPRYLDETGTAALRLWNGREGRPGVPSGGVVSVETAEGFELLEVGPALSSPEAVYGFDGYGLTVSSVNTAIGNFVHAETDVVIAGVGPSLQLTRTYNSSDRRIGMFGQGWTSSFETRVFENCVTGDVTILREDGRREFHQSDGQGGYVVPDGYTATLTKNGGSGWTLEELNGMTWEFRTDGRLTSIVDADGHGLTLSWNGADQLASVTDDVTGRFLTFTHAGDRVATVSTNPVTIDGATAPLTWTYHYTGSHLTRVCDARNNDPDTGFCRDYGLANGLITEVIDANDNIDKRVSYANGKVEWEENGAGDRTRFTYSATETTITDDRDNETKSQFDGQYRLVKVIDPLLNELIHEYNDAGYRFRTTDGNGNITERGFDDDGNVTWERNGEDETTWFEYDDYNNVEEVRDGRSANETDNTYLVTTTWDGPARNKLTETTPPTASFPTGTQRSWAYTDGTETAIGGGTMPAGLLKTETDARSATTQYDYDASGNLRQVTDRAGLVTQFGYDELGRQTSQTTFPDQHPAGVSTTTQLDQLGNPVVVTGPAVTNVVSGDVHRLRVTNTFDAAVNLVSIVEADIGGSASPDATRTTLTAYDGADRPTVVTDPEGNTLTTDYDEAGNVEFRIDQNGRRFDYEYDERNLLITETAIGVGPGGTDVTIAEYTYDGGGLLDTSTDHRGRVTRHDFDGANRPDTVTLLGYDDRSGSTRDIVLSDTDYDPAGNPSKVVTGGVRTETLEYDEAGWLISTTFDPDDPNKPGVELERTTSFVHDANGNVEIETLSDGSRTETITRTFDAADRVTSETIENGAADLVTTYEFDNSAMTAMVEPRGNASGADPADYRVTFETDELGRTTRTVSPAIDVFEDGATVTGVQPDVLSGYDTFGQPTHTRDERGNVTRQDYDRLGRVSTITHPTYTTPGGTSITPTETFGYDGVGNLILRLDRRGQTTTFAFDYLDRATRQVDPSVGGASAGVIVTEYDDAQALVTVTDQIGAVVEYRYDDLDRVRTETQIVRRDVAPDDRYTTTYDYNDVGDVTFVETPGGSETESVYNAASELTKAIDGDDFETDFTYDVRGRQTSVSDPLDREIVTEYDLAGRPTEVRRLAPDDTVLTTATSSYDEAGNLTGTTSARGFTTTYQYDVLGRLTQMVQPVSPTESITTSYGYDRGGNLTASTNGEQHTTEYGYNVWNLQDELIEPSTTAHPALSDRTWVTIFDAGGLPVQSDEPGGVVVARTFDELGRLTLESGSGGGAPSATRSFDYDAAGRTTEVGSPSGPIVFEYDDRGLLVSTSGNAAQTASFDYDDDGRMRQRTDAAGTSTFDYNDRHLLQTATDALTGVQATYLFNDAGQLGSVSWPTGSTRTYGYDDLGRLQSDELRAAGGALMASYGYGYDDDDNVTSRDVNLPGNSGSGVHTFGYDRAGRLETWTRPDATIVSYGWDDAGNLIDNDGVASQFDERNRLTTSGSTAYTWAPRGTMVSTDDGGTTTNYTFDALGRATSTAGVAYSYDSLDRVVGDGSSTFAYAGFEIDPVQAGDLLVARSPGAVPIATQQGAAAATLLGRNRHGDVGFHFDTSATVSATRTYDPFGEVVDETGSLTALGFQGDYTDATTGDVWMGARWYRPGTGSFVSRDPLLAQPDTLLARDLRSAGTADQASALQAQAARGGMLYLANRFGGRASADPLANAAGMPYSYANSNPITLADPTGLIYDNPDGSYTRETAQVFETAQALREDGIPFTLTHQWSSISEGSLLIETYDSWILRVVNEDGHGWEEGSHFHTNHGVYSGRRLYDPGYKVGSIGSTCGRWCNAGKLGVFAVSAIAVIGCTGITVGVGAGACAAGVGSGSAWATGAMEGEFGVGWDELLGGVLGAGGVGYLRVRPKAVGASSQQTASTAPQQTVGWRVGDSIDNLTAAGNVPSWSAVRARYWKNRAASALDGEYTAAQLQRMRAGKAPLHPTHDVPMELDHIVPRHAGGGHNAENLRELWPWEHAQVDPYRYYTGPRP